MASLDALHPAFREAVQRLLEEGRRRGLDLVVVQGHRTPEEQDALYAQGRTAPGQIVTQARGGQSLHNYGVSVDVVPRALIGTENWSPESPLWQQVGETARAVGLEWGGDWQGFVDRPHVQLAGTGGWRDLSALPRDAQGFVILPGQTGPRAASAPPTPGAPPASAPPIPARPTAYAPTPQPTGAVSAANQMAGSSPAGSPAAPVRPRHPILEAWRMRRQSRGLATPLLDRLLGIGPTAYNTVQTIPMRGDASGAPAYGTGGFGAPPGYTGAPGTFAPPQPRPVPGQGMQVAPPTNQPVQVAQPAGGGMVAQPYNPPMTVAQQMGGGTVAPAYNPPVTVAQPIDPRNSAPFGGQSTTAPPMNAPLTMAPQSAGGTVAQPIGGSATGSPIQDQPAPASDLPANVAELTKLIEMIAPGSSQPTTIAPPTNREPTNGLFGSRPLQDQRAPMTPPGKPPFMLAGGSGRQAPPTTAAGLFAPSQKPASQYIPMTPPDMGFTDPKDRGMGPPLRPRPPMPAMAGPDPLAGLPANSRPEDRPILDLIFKLFGGR